MEHAAALIKENFIAFSALATADILAALLLSKKLCTAGSKRVAKALGARAGGCSPHDRHTGLVGRGVAVCEKYFRKSRRFEKVRTKMRKAGYGAEYAAMLYLFIRYVFSPIAFIAAFLLNYPDIVRPLASVVLINTVMESVISANKRKINLRFQKYIYKIYKYLHNQVSSGVKPTDAIRSVYEVTDDSELRAILVRLAARYELTVDIDSALEEFKSNFDAHEADTLCIALKQGIETGDNSELLSKQEDVMFKKYFNYIQAETDSCKNRSVAAAAVFVAIVVVMIIVPMIAEMGQAIGNIFIN